VAVRLYDEALALAPGELQEDLKTVRRSFDRGARNEPQTESELVVVEEAAERLVAYNERVCGFPLYLGSLD
jgi:hypothetical protein